MKISSKVFVVVICIFILIFTTNSIALLAGSSSPKTPAPQSDYLYVMMQQLFEEAVANGEYQENEFYKFVSDMFPAPQGEPGTSDVWKSANTAIQSSVEVVAYFSSGGEYPRSGSGVVYYIDNAGGAFIITNYHVIGTFYSGTSNVYIADFVLIWAFGALDTDYMEGYVCGVAPQYDLAMIYVEDIETEGAPLVATSKIELNAPVIVGSTAVAIGNPLSLGISVSSGVISSVSREVKFQHLTSKTELYQTIRCLQIDTAVNSGNSGGGLFDKNGRLIGIINLSAMTWDEDLGGYVSAQGISYAIPADTVYRVANQLVLRFESNSCVTLSEPSLTLTSNLKAVSGGFNYVDVGGESVAVPFTKYEVRYTRDGFTRGDLLYSIKYQVSTLYNTFEHGIIINNLYELTEALIDCWRADAVIEVTVKRGNDLITVPITLNVA